jgi:hypothetical protein
MILQMKRLILTTLVMICLSLPAMSEMMMISIEELRDAAPNIVDATYIGPADHAAFSYYLDVHEVLKGKLKVGRCKVFLGSGHVTLRPGARVIAFLTKDLGFSWYGAPQGLTKNPADDVWDFEGFYDFNGYMVSTHDLTLPMIRDFFVEYKPIHWHHKGFIHFYDPQKNSLVQSKYAIDVRSTHMQLPVKFQTNLPLHDFAADTGKPNFRGGMYTVLESSDSSRSMGIDGEIVGVDVATGTYTCNFWICSPYLFTEEMLLAFLEDTEVDHPWYELVVQAPEGGSWRIDLGRYSGTCGGIDNTPWGSLKFASISSTPISFVTGYGGGERLELNSDVSIEEAHGIQARGTTEGIAQLLMLSPIECKVYRGSKENPSYLGPATLMLKQVHFGSD